MNCCEEKKTKRSEEFKKNLTKHLNIISGQVNGVKKMIEDDKYCIDVITQISAIISSLKSVSNKVLDNHLHSCVIKSVKEGNEDAIDEIVALFKKV